MKAHIIEIISIFAAIILCLSGNSPLAVSAENTYNMYTKDISEFQEEKTDGILNKNNFISKENGENIMNNDSSILEKNLSANAGKVLLSQNKNDENSDAEGSPVSSFERALELVENGGEIIISGKYTLPSDFKWRPHSKLIKISGDTLDCSNLSALKVRDSVIFDDIDIVFKEGALLYACGNRFKIGENTNITGEIAFFGGEYGDAVEACDVTLLSGNYSYIYGGGNYSDVKGDINLYIGGKVNNLEQSGFAPDKPHAIFGGCIQGDVFGNISVTVQGKVNQNLDYKNHESLASVNGGCNGGKVKGKIELTVGDEPKFNYVFGGGCEKNSDVSGGITLDFYGKAMSVIGGSAEGDINCDVTVNFLSGWTEQVFGGCEKGTVHGNTEVNLLGGTVTRRIFGGCYNYLKRKFIFLIWETDCHVKGNTTVNISDEANLEFSFKTNGVDDLGVSASSRHKKNFKDENATLTFSNSKAKEKYQKNIGIKTGSFFTDLIIKFAKPYDNCYINSAANS